MKAFVPLWVPRDAFTVVEMRALIDAWFTLRVQAVCRMREGDREMSRLLAQDARRLLHTFGRRTRGFLGPAVGHA